MPRARYNTYVSLTLDKKAMFPRVCLSMILYCTKMAIAAPNLQMDVFTKPCGPDVRLDLAGSQVMNTSAIRCGAMCQSDLSCTAVNYDQKTSSCEVFYGIIVPGCNDGSIVAASGYSFMLIKEVSLYS